MTNVIYLKRKIYERNDWVFKTAAFLITRTAKKELTYPQAVDLAKFLYHHLPISHMDDVLRFGEPLETIDEYGCKATYPPLRHCEETQTQITMLKEALIKEIFPIPFAIRLLKLCVELYDIEPE